MRFTKPFWSGIADGSITVAFRRWDKPTVVVGRPYRTGGGRVEVRSVEVIEETTITDDDARRAGHADADDVRVSLRQMAERSRAGADAGDRANVYRVEFRLLDGPDPREQLAADDDLGPDDIAGIDTRLDRLDLASKIGPWTRPTLALIADHPATRAPDLAEMAGRETQPFKLDVRKLKNLGLTISLGVGYRLSPRGRAYLDGIAGAPRRSGPPTGRLRAGHPERGGVPRGRRLRRDARRHRVR